MFNEEENLKETLDRIAETLKAFTEGPWEVIIVNDGSLDETQAKADQLATQPAIGAEVSPCGPDSPPPGASGWFRSTLISRTIRATSSR
jgi:glycosyltransferase involved in cell wall biosynthesis